MRKFKLSIIIPTWNRKKKLIKLIQLLLPNLIKNKIIFQIIICDSFSTDGTQEEIKKKFKNKKQIFYRNILENSISKKRNFGIKLSKYPNILLLDDDCVPIESFFIILKKYLINCKKNEVF